MLADDPKFTILIFASVASLLVLAMLDAENRRFEGRSNSPLIPLISMPAY
jgi:hypothetical protein